MESSSLLSDAHPAGLSGRYPGFTSFKTSSPIHYQRRWIRDALIQATLDDRILEIGPTIIPVRDLPPPAEFSFRQRRYEGFGVALLSQVPKTLEVRIDDHRVSVIERADLVRGPMAAASRLIWAQKRLKVDPGDRYRAVELIARRDGVAQMSEVVAALRNQSLDPVHQVFALLATGYLTTRLHLGIGHGTPLRIGPWGLSA